MVRFPSFLHTLSIVWLLMTLGCSFDPAGLSDPSSNTNNVNNSDPVCGDGVAEGTEVCDDTDLDGRTCVVLGYDGGTLACSSTCDTFDTSACEGTGPICGNGVIEGLESCDGTDLAGETCVSQGFDSGTLACAAGCMGFDTSACEGTPPVCGDDTAEGDEPCDGIDLAGQSCASLGYAGGGALACAPDCSGFDTTACLGSVCGDDQINGDELCDGTDLGGETCETQGFFAGDLACASNCTGLDTSACVDNICGNNAVEEVETCDGTDLAGLTCETEGFFAGDLTCAADCMSVDTSACVDNICGNVTIEGPELCDSENVNGLTCHDFGCYRGTLLCNDQCSDYDADSCLAGHDEDGDGFDDNCDNCPSYPNIDQADTDGDGVGDACEGGTDIHFINTISAFDPLMDSQSSWTIYPLASGIWNYNSDDVDGVALTGSSYILDYTTPQQNYSVETTFHYDQTANSGVIYAAVTFAWQTTGGMMQSAWQCTYSRSSKKLTVQEYVLEAGNTGWQERSAVTVSTSVSDAQWHKLRAYVSTGGFRCEYVDEASGYATLDQTSGTGSTAMSGQVGVRVYRDKAVFTSFVIY